MHHYRHKAPFDDAHLCVIDIETISGEVMEDKSFPPWPTHTPVIASVLTADRSSFREWSFGLETIRFNEDERALDRIDELLTGRSAVTLNGAGFDFRVLLLAAERARNFRLRALTAAATQPRFGSIHYDLAEKYSAYGAARGASLERLCEALGIPAKMGTHGDQVGQLYDVGKIDEIAEYCETDVAATLMLFAHHRAMELGDAEYHAALTYQFVRWLQVERLDHLMPFTEVYDLRELLRQSLLGQLDGAVRTAATDADLRTKQALDAAFAETEITAY